MNPERNIIVIPAVLLMLLLCGSLSAQFSGGSGSERDPYLIATTGDLDMIRSYRSSHFLQTADIDLNVYPYNDGIGWFPIGIDSSSPFTGSFDGDGHHIINLFINNPMHAHVGLFGYLSGAKILRVNLDSVNITCDYNSGTLAGVCVDTDIMNCSVSGTIQSGDHDIGGLVAYLSSGCLVSHCYTSVIVSGGHYVGGIASWLNNSEISDCHALGSVQGLDSCGGLIGDMASGVVRRSYAIGLIDGQSICGGVTGMCRSSSQIIDSFARCQITANSHVGGISGTMENTGVITNCYSASSLNCESMDGGITGGNITGEIASSYWDTDLSGVTFNVFGEARTTTQMTFPINNDTYIGWDFVDIWCADVNFTVNAGYPYLLEEPVDIDDENLPQTPLRYNLTAYPNPFLTTAYIMIKQDNASGIKPVKVFTMTIYNLRGQKVSNLPVISNGFDDMISFWDGHDSRGRSCSEGIYVSILYADGKPCSGTRLTLLRK